MRKFNINVEGKNYLVEVEEIGGVATTTYIAPVVSAPVATQAPAPKAVGAGVPFKSPMPGLIKDVKVANGAMVKKGDVVLVLEAMKMDNDMAATADGKVTIVASKGSSINSGDVLFTIA